MFIGEIDAHMRKLLANPAQAKPADFHYMHGSAANMGFSALATACKAAEDACHTGNLPDMAGIEMAFHGALDDLQAAMPNILLPA
ncbi:hypothetical protein roselon_01160 [Roseibacterium elongatum DSM 19469]|uniref:HPt domain-containing protein n=2 Tax=Roseicyclus elongatus TaxID=159346 RepID=W8S438_9RHOB|nr:hypothetical protein roselon_01160 [Roseibacterium elongatum DSM 19469]